MVSAVALLACLTDPLVSYGSDAIRIDILLAELSSQTHIRLTCTPEIAAEAVVVQFKDRPLDEVRGRMAKVIGAQWASRNGGYSLERSPELKHSQSLAEKEQIESQISNLFQNLHEEFEKQPKFGEAEALKLIHRVVPKDAPADEFMKSFVRLQSSNPATRACVALLRAVGSSKLQQMYVGQRTVFSDSCTPTQSALPSSTRPLLDRLKADASLMLSIRERPRPEGQFVNVVGLPEVGPGTFENGYGKTLLAVQRTALARFRYSLTMVDSENKRILFASGEFPDRSRIRAAPYSGKGDPLVVSESAKAFAFLKRDVGVAAGGAPRAKLDDGTDARVTFSVSHPESLKMPPDLGLGTMLYDPVKNDPVGFVLGSLLRQVATLQAKPLIASCSDGAIIAASDLAFLPKVTSQDFLDFLNQSHVEEAIRVPNARQIMDPEWLLFQPLFQVESRQKRVNRSAVKAFLAAIRANGTATLSDAARYIQSSPSPPRFGSLDMMYLTHAGPTVDKRAVEWLVGPALSFLVTLTPSQIETLSTSGLQFENLSVAQRENIRRWFYDDESFRRQFAEPRIGTVYSGSPQDMGSALMLKGEPTERFPSGVPSDMRILIKRQEFDAVLARATTGFHYLLNLDSLAYQEMQGTEGEFIGNKYSRHFVGYRPMKEVSYVISMWPEKDFELKSLAGEFKPVAGAREISRPEFPSSFTERMNRVKRALGWKGG